MKHFRQIAWLAMFWAVCTVAQEQTPEQVRSVTIPAGTTIRLRFVNPVSVRRIRDGKPVILEATDPVVIDGTTVIAQGTRFDGGVEPIETTVNGKARVTLRLELNHIVYGDSSAADLTGPGGKRPTAIAKVGQAIPEHPLKKPLIRAGIILGVGVVVGAAIGNIPTGVAMGLGAGGASLMHINDGRDRSLFVRRNSKVDIVLDQSLELDPSRISTNR